MKRVFALVLAAAAVMIAASCSLASDGNDSSGDVSVTGAEFTEESVQVAVGEVKHIAFSVKPGESTPYVSVEYSLSDQQNQYISLSNETSSGLVITGVKAGNCVLIAKCRGFQSYLDVVVSGSVEDAEPYIVTPAVAYEIKEGERKNFQVSLYGGNQNDNAFFDWQSSDTESVEITPVSNAVIVTGKKCGKSRITITNPKSKMPASVMVYVTKDEAAPCYITTDQNAYQVSLSGGTQQFQVSLAGSKNNDMSLFQFSVKEGNDRISLISNNNFFSITPSASGTAVIECSHPEAEDPVEIQIVVVKTTSDPYIESDDNFIIIDTNEGKTVKCSVVGSTSSDDNYKFKWALDRTDIIKVSQVNNCFYIEPLKEGAAHITVTNDNVKLPHEIYCVVQDYASQAGSCYITTGQNLVRIEKGSDAVLKMQLIGGNEADRNSFKWIVDDSSVINLDTVSGSVQYARAAVQDSTVQSVLEASAVISAKKEGTAVIKITNPKSAEEASVKVKVYPKGALAESKPYLTGNPVIKVVKGSKVTETVRLSDSGSAVSAVEWSTDDAGIASAAGTGLTAVITGTGSGVTQLNGRNSALDHDYSAVVLSGTEEEIASFKTIYSDNRSIELFTGLTGNYEIKSTGNVSSSSLSVSVNDAGIAKARLSENVLIISAVKAGSTEIVVSSTEAVNKIVFIVKVEDDVTIDKPYYFTCSSFEGIVVGKSSILKAVLSGADEADKKNIQWSCDDGSVVKITGNGEECKADALKKGEAVVTARSPKSAKDARIVVYTADTQEELDSRIVLSAEKNNYLSSVGNDIYVTVSVNNPDANREKIVWESDDISVCSVDSNYDNAYIRCLEEGFCTVTVRCGNASPLKIYISVKKSGESTGEKNLTVPAIVQIVNGNAKTVTAVAENMTSAETAAIAWESDSALISCRGNAESCYIQAVKTGYSEITVRQKSLGIERKISVITADTEEELQSAVVMALEKSLYVMKKDDTQEVRLSFGTAKPDDGVKSKIKWTSSDSGIAEVVPNGDSAAIRAAGEGIASVSVKGEGIINSLSFKVQVGTSAESGNGYYLSCEKMIGLVTGSEKTVSVSILDGEGNKITTGLDEIKCETGSEGVAQVTQADEILVVKALKAGQTYITVSHPEVKDKIRILVYAADTQKELESMYPLSADKDHYLLSVGDSAVLCVNTVSDEKISGIKWAVSNTAVCSYAPGADKKSMKVTAKKAGVCTFTASHSDSAQSVNFVVTVTESGSADLAKTIVTESIIGLVPGKDYTTEIQTNLTDDECAGLVWSSGDESVAKAEGNGRKCTVTPVKEGRTELTVKYSSVLYRTIVVYVCASDAAVKAYKAMNIDERYSVIRTDSTRTYTVCYGKAFASAKNTVFTDVYKNNVVSIDSSDGKLRVTGLNEGIALIRCSNAETNSFDLFVEVNRNAAAKDAADAEQGYLTITKNVYVLDKDDTINPAVINVVPVQIDSKYYSSIRWTCSDPSVATAAGSGTACDVYANKEGTAEISVSSVYSANVLTVKIIVASKDQILTPHIKLSADTAEVEAGGTLRITASAENVENYDITKFSCSLPDDGKEYCEAACAGNEITVKGLLPGQTVLSVKYETMQVNIVVSVKGSASNFVYLSTENQYTVLCEKSSVLLGVELHGYEEINESSFAWTPVDYTDDSGVKTVSSDLITLTGSGASRLCTAKKAGTAKIKVVHANPLAAYSATFPVYLTVKVEEYENANPVYIKSDNTVVTVTEGSKATIKCTLEHGSEADYSEFSWTNNSEKFIRLTSAGAQCVVEGLVPGVAQITVQHPDCIGQNCSIVVVVEKKAAEETKYISTDSSVIEMKPTDSYKQITVSLTGGTPEENTLFTYQVLSFESTVKNKDGTSNEVISMNGSQDNVIVKPLREGTAIIRVTNSATTMHLDIKIIVTLYSSLAFTEKSRTIMAGKTDSVEVNAPTGKTVIYESGNDDVATVTGTSKICIIEGVAPGTAVISAHTSDGSSADELIVTVTKNTETVTDYIKSSVNVITLNTLDDTAGYKIKAELCGTDATAADQDGIVWTLNGGTKTVSIAGVTGNTATGNEITVRPVAAGEETIIISHAKAKNSKKVYVSVEQSAAALKIDSDGMVLQREQVQGVNAVLSGAAESEQENIVWSRGGSSRSDGAEVFQIVLSETNGTKKGASVQVKAVAIGEQKLVCSYGSITKSVNVIVKDIPSIYIQQGNMKVAVDETITVPVIVTPEEYYDRIQFQTNSSLYATVKGVADDAAKSYSLQITGGVTAGITTLKVWVDSLNVSAQVSVTTSDELYMVIDSYTVTESDGTERLVTAPTMVQERPDVKSVRCHYHTEPKGGDFTPEAGNIAWGDLSDATPISAYTGRTEALFSLSYGTEPDTYAGQKSYFELKPIKAGYGTVDFVNKKNPGVKMSLPVSFTYNTFAPKITVTRSGGSHSTWDNDNGIINLANGEKITLSVDASSVPADCAYYVMPCSNDTLKKPVFTTNTGYIINSPVDVAGGSSRYSAEYYGMFTIEIAYPKYYGLEGVYRKTYIVSKEQWK